MQNNNSNQYQLTDNNYIAAGSFGCVFSNTTNLKCNTSQNTPIHLSETKIAKILSKPNAELELKKYDKSLIKNHNTINSYNKDEKYFITKSSLCNPIDKLKLYNKKGACKLPIYDPVVIIYENGGEDLFVYLSKISFDIDKIKKILHNLKNIIEGLKILHSNNIAHCDLKINNIVIGKDDNNYRLIDFGTINYTNLPLSEEIREEYGWAGDLIPYAPFAGLLLKEDPANITEQDIDRIVQKYTYGEEILNLFKEGGQQKNKWYDITYLIKDSQNNKLLHLPSNKKLRTSRNSRTSRNYSSDNNNNNSLSYTSSKSDTSVTYSTKIYSYVKNTLIDTRDNHWKENMTEIILKAMDIFGLGYILFNVSQYIEEWVNKLSSDSKEKNDALKILELLFLFIKDNNLLSIELEKIPKIDIVLSTYDIFLSKL